MYSLTHHRGKSGRRLIHRATRTIAVVAACASLPSAEVAHAQFWQQDPAFAPVLESPAHPEEQKITALARQPDGKLLATGYVERVNGQARTNPAAPLRFNADGSLDATFQAADAADGLYLQPSGKIVTPGGLRLHADGSRDLTFHFASDLRTVESMDALGRLYVRRNDGTLVRTTIDGVDDGQFRSQVIPVSANAIAPFADGSVAVAFLAQEEFPKEQHPASLIIVGLRADGAEDPGFKREVNMVPSNTFLGLVALPDGRVLLYGSEYYTQAGNSTRFMRFDRSGLLDYDYLSPGSRSSAPDALTLAGVLYDLLRDPNAAPGTQVRVPFLPRRFTAMLDVGNDGTLWLASAISSWVSPGAPVRYTRSSTTALTIDPRPTIAFQLPVGPFGTSNNVVGTPAGLSAPMPGGLLPLTYQWYYDGTPISGATTESLSHDAMAVRDVGAYTVVMSNAYGSVTSWPMILGVLSDHKTAGAAIEVGADIVHPNMNVYDQVLLSGAAAAVTADAGQVTRLSFVDLTNDIVQVELAGAGTLALVLENASGPAPAAFYNQPNVRYVRGHPGIVVAGANRTTNLSVFSVGRVTAVDQALFRDDVDYDGMADVAFIAISTTGGEFGGLRTANVQYYAHQGLTGVYAPGVIFTGPVYIGDIDAFDTATPVLVLGGALDLRIAGGDLRQTNGRLVRVGHVTPSQFTAGTTSHGDPLPAQPNRGTFEPDLSPLPLGWPR